ncbi:MAG: ferrous iron transport protein B, partial [Candidatus Neomarinimicrobiota bacterium]
LAAKEIIISTLGILYGVTEETAEAASKSHMTSVGYQISRDPSYSPLMAISLMVFVMLYTPCLATLVMVKKELGRLRWALFQAAFTLGIAYLMAVIIFKVGSFLLPLL